MAKFHLPSIEEEILKGWSDQDTFRKVLAKPGKKGNFVFFEGPPTANGKPGIHHLLTRAFKDVILRFRTMQGYHIDRKAGWDTHGLPVELEVEKQLGFTKKQDIETYGIAKFNAKCKESVWTYLDLWQKSTKRIGFWVDLDDPYVTYRNEYVESLWHVIKEIDAKGLLYKGYRITPHCPRCVTSLSSHELAQGYKDVEDPSVYIKFAIDGKANRFFLVWTTTPWTLAGNVALAVGADVDYVAARLKDTGETLILARARLSSLTGEYEITEEMKGSALAGTAYRPLYATLDPADPRAGNAHKAYLADFVSTGDGTGIVHIAPAFGEDDARLGESAKLPTLLTVDPTGLVTADVPGKGRFIKKADDDVKADLAARGLLYRSETYLHSYPFCWRCGTPLLYYAKSSWYVRMSELRDKLIAMNRAVNWVPEHIKEGRFGEWLKDVKDWAFSRERYWGTPLPVWQCGACQKTEVVGSFDDMERLARPKNRYFLQRHGESETNATNTLSSWPERKAFHLTEKGRGQVAASAATLKGKKIDLIFASDLLRTTETAEAISKAVGVPIVFDERLRELNVGEFNAKSEAAHSAFFKDGDKDRFTVPSPGGECLNDVRRRMVAFIKEIDAKYSGKNIVIVSHGDPLWILQTAVLGLSDEETLKWPHYNKVGEFSEMVVKNIPRDELGRPDVHRPYVDDVLLACSSCKETMRRVTDVADVWFDSGAMPFAQWHYPFENAARIDGDGATNFPADFISEAIDQTRGWFYTLLAVSTLLDRKTPPYKNVICLGHVLDAKGQKMSKSKGNVIDPFKAIDTYGADAIRYYFFTVNQPGEAKRFDEKEVDEVVKKVFLIAWNVLTFYKMYAEGEEKGRRGEEGETSTHVMDRWILSELGQLRYEVTRGLETYNVVDAGRAISDFITDLSTWYVRRSRDRFKAGGESRHDAVATLGTVLRELAKLMAPFTPFFAEALYREAGGSAGSVHLADWPETSAAEGADALRGSMRVVRQAASIGLEARAKAGMPVRQVLAKATVTSVVAFEPWMLELLADELNVETVIAAANAEGAVSVELDTVLTDDLKRKGALRDLVRNVNDMRKTSGLTVQDRIVVSWSATGDLWKQVFGEHGEAFKAGVLANALVEAREEGVEGREVTYDGQTLFVSIKKV